jgi:asparagine synthetase B (glutamine-hydrolysing)
MPGITGVIGTDIDKLVSTFKKAVERRMVGIHRFGVSLSRGLDSRIVLGAIDKKTFSHSYEKTGIRADSPILLRKFAILIKTLIDDSKRKLRSKTKGLISISVTSGYPENFS